MAQTDDAMLASVRRRSQSYLGYLLWVFVILAGLLAANAAASLAARWVDFLHGIRRAAGLRAPVDGPDFWILGGMAAAVLAAALVVLWGWGAYRRAWRRRLVAVWGERVEAGHTRIRGLAVREPARQAEYVNALAATREWSGLAVPVCNDRASYEAASAALLRSIEIDIAQRAVTAGLVVGLNRNPLIDSLTIMASALELQMHVLARLGKRPSARTWIEMLKRTGASLFLNSYVGRDDALYLNLAIRKAALGLELAADAVNEGATALSDIDWDEVLHGVSVPGLSAVTSMATMGMSVGAFGLRQIGMFVEATANDLLQGVLAGGVLYYHGMSLAADCLALDGEHRHSAEMTRTIGQAMTVACAPAGRLLRDQVRRMREFLRERRRMALTMAKEKSKEGAGRIWEAVKGRASGLTRGSSEESE